MNNIRYTRVGDLGMKLDFLNGTIIVPDEYGGYVIAPGCGTGKTTAIKQIIKENYKTGILYSAFTIEECNEMYEFCKSLVNPDDPEGLKKDDIIVLHSDYKSEGVDNNLWRNDPEKLMDKRIIICTHHKLMNEDPRLLCMTSFNIQESEDELDDWYTRSVSRKSYEPLPRRYLLIDEVPTTKSSPIIVTKELLLKLSSKIGDDVMGLIPAESASRIKTNELTTINGTHFIKSDSFSSFRKQYYTEKKINDSISVADNSTKLGEIREGLYLSSLYKNYSTAWNDLNQDEEGAPKSTKIVPSFLNVVCKKMETTLLLFDGTGDLTFYGSKVLEVLTMNTPKYNSPIDLIKFPFNLKRRQSSSSDLNEKIRSTVDKLVGILKDNKKTLIVTWKNFKGTEIESQDSFINEVVNESKLLPEFYRSALEGRGFIQGKDFEVIHYQSGLDKATNKFMDCDSVIFLGEFHVPDSVIDEFNSTFRCKTTPEFYLLYQLAQTVCRTRIRLHNGLPIRIYYSDDWNDIVMTSLYLYFTGRYPTMDNNVTSIKKIETYDPDLSYIKPRFKDDVKSLLSSGLLPGLESSLSRGLPMNYEIKLKDLYEILPRANYQVRSYDALLRYLKSMGIIIRIKAESNKSK